MPELPDVQVFKQYFDATALHQTVDEVEVLVPRLLKKGLSARSLQVRLKGRRFERTRRHGKYLLAETDGAGSLLLHFGMTGRLQYGKFNSDTPDHTGVLFRFDNGYALAYINVRKLGTVGLVEHTEQFLRDEDLGVDALDEELDTARFSELARAHRKAVKCWLMDQSLIAGIGNIYSDEILFQARLHPKRSTADLSDAELGRLYRKMHEVLDAAIAAKAEPGLLPPSYLLPHREKGERCPECGGPVEPLSACGRTAYYCPECQSED
jgi:formamidopyrimidine-DNA glycosylase